MTRLALRREVQRCTTPGRGHASAAAAACRVEQAAARAQRAQAVPARPRKARRVRLAQCAEVVGQQSHRSHRHDLVIVSWRFRIARATCVQAASSTASRSLGDRRPADVATSRRPRPGRPGTASGACAQQLGEHARPRPRGAAPQRPRVGPAQPGRVARPALAQDPLREDARRLDVGRVVEQHQRLLRRVRARPFGVHSSRLGASKASRLGCGNVRCH